MAIPIYIYLIIRYLVLIPILTSIVCAFYIRLYMLKFEVHFAGNGYACFFLIFRDIYTILRQLCMISLPFCLILSFVCVEPCMFTWVNHDDDLSREKVGFQMLFPQFKYTYFHAYLYIYLSDFV